MPNNATAKIKLAHKKHLFASIILVVCLLFVAVAVMCGVRGVHARYLQFGPQTYILEIADTNSTRQKGLSDRKAMPANHAMLFEYANQDVRCFWMKDMHFPLDIVWLSSSRTVLHIESHVEPNTFPRTYCPKQPAQYVIEFDAGQTESSQLRIGQVLNF